MAKDLPIDPRIVQILSKATIKNLIDGIVELMTNSDDSYRRLEEKGISRDGKIKISVCREKGGRCKKLVVEDFAEGMSGEELEKAIVFGAETSGLIEGKSVRGLFGRGLKETIIALGEGEIISRKKGFVVKTRLWLDKDKKKPQYDDEMIKRPQPSNEPDGTKINIKISNEKIKIPELETFKLQLSSHFALRDINSSPEREIWLEFEDLRKSTKMTIPIKFKPPNAELVWEEEFCLSEYGDKVFLKIYESLDQLSSPKNNPYGLAGILIKTSAAIIDNQLFKFENDPAALYFFGEAFCPELEKRLREGETELIDPNRGGMEWRHDYCKTLAEMIEQRLEPLVSRKRKEIVKIPDREVNEPTKKMIRNLCSLLNGIAKQELSEVPDVPVEPTPDINILTIKPEIANIQKDIPRTFSIYAPTRIIQNEGDEAKIKSSIWEIYPLSSRVKLERHPKFPKEIWYKSFKVVGIVEGAEGNIIVNLGKEEAISRVKVGPAGHKSRGQPTGIKGGFIHDIKPDLEPSPMQRVIYKDGVIRVFIRFPSVWKFLKAGFEGVETPEGKMLLAELVGEAFCRQLAIQGFEIGKYPKIPGREIECYNATINELQKKYLEKIQQAIFNWKPRD